MNKRLESVRLGIGALRFLLINSSPVPALGQGNSNGHGKSHNKHSASAALRCRSQRRHQPRDAPNQSGKFLRGGDAANQVFLLELGFGADGEGVEEIEPESEIEGFVLAVAQLTLAEDFHADDAFAGGTHFTDDADDGIRVGIHDGPNGIDSNEMNFDPGRFGGDTERFDVVA